jgi:branched-subunit amino acid aminotransferase/4-amino-4-deoxychorismate lyase
MAGVTRGAVMALAEKQFIPVIEGVYELADLVDADEIFLTSASLGIALVTTFDFRQYSFATANIYARLADALKDLISENKS